MLFKSCIITVLYLLTFTDCSRLNTTSLLQHTFGNILQGKLIGCDEVVKLVPDCMKQYVNDLCDLEGWALKMFDATGKLQSGIATGNLNDLGSFDECLEIDEVTPKVKGQYCLATIDLGNTAYGPINYLIGVCIPNTCSLKDLSELSTKLPLYINDGFCQSKDSQPGITTGDIICIVFLSIMALLLILSTAYESYLYYLKKEAKWDCLLSFSMLRNGRKLFVVTDKPNQLKCIAGIRTLSMMWIVLSHGYSVAGVIPMENSFDVLQWYTHTSSMYVIGATVAVDSFFLMGGIVLIYVFMGSMKKDTYFNVPMYYIHRYLRLTPALAAVVAIHVSILKHFGSGPLWPLTEKFMSSFCKDYWWSTILYAQNYYNSDAECVSQTWYLSVDMQLFILSPLILIPLRRYAKSTMAFVAALTCACIGAGFYISWHYKLAVVQNSLRGGNMDYMSKFYMKTHTRAAPWLIGLIVGYYIYQAKRVSTSFRINKTLNVVLWMASLAVLCTCVFVGVDLITKEYVAFEQTSYNVFIRPAWSIALAWIIFSCVTGYGGPVNAFLSLPIFQVLARLAYSMYLVHYTILNIRVNSTRGNYIFSDLGQMIDFWSNFMITLGISIIWTLTFESPVMELEKLIFGKTTPKQPLKGITKVQDINETCTIPEVKLKV